MVLGSGSRMVQMEHYGIREWFSNGSNENIMVLGSGSRMVQMEHYGIREWFSNGSNGTLWY